MTGEPLPFTPHQTVGLLGGSFNPAHAGHVHLSLEACKRLRLDRVLWLVSPQNPLKSQKNMADYDRRVERAEALTAPHSQLSVTRLERQINSRYTIDTLHFLTHHYPQTRFVWLMGSDNLQQMHRWHCWREIMQLVPVAVFDRAPFSHAALRSPAALTFQKQRLPDHQLPRLALSAAPAWSYVFMPRHPESASDLRKKLGKKAFMVHN